jgi:hypothetical protein
MIVRDAKGIKVDGVGNSPGKRHVKSTAPRGGYRPRKQCQDDYGEKTLHEDAKVGNTVKLEDSVNRAKGKETVCKYKWVKKEAPPSPRRPNEKRSRPADNEEGKKEETEEENMMQKRGLVASAFIPLP